MDKQVKAEWLAALRSGKFKKGTGCLKSSYGSGTRHCCLGVLGEIKGLEITSDGSAFSKDKSNFYPSLEQFGLEADDRQNLWFINDTLNAEDNYAGAIKYIEDNL